MDTYMIAPPALTAAVKSFLKANQMPTTVSVAVEKQAPGYTRVRVTLESGQADPAIAFVRQEGETYRVLGFGTFFEPSFYQEEGIPASLRL